MNTNTLTNKKQALLEAIANKRKKSADEGFSLIELIVVVLVIGIIAAIAIPVFLNAQENARESAVEGTAANALTSATAALNTDRSGEDFETPASAVAAVDAQNDDIDVELTTAAEDATDVDQLCVRAQHTQGANATTTTGPALDCDETTTFPNLEH